MTSSGDGQHAVSSSSATGRFGTSIGTVPEGLLRDVMTSALPFRTETMNGERGGREGGGGVGGDKIRLKGLGVG